MESPGAGRRVCAPLHTSPGCSPRVSHSGAGLGRVPLLSWAPPSLGGDAASLTSYWPSGASAQCQRNATFRGSPGVLQGSVGSFHLSLPSATWSSRRPLGRNTSEKEPARLPSCPGGLRETPTSSQHHTGVQGHALSPWVFSASFMTLFG